jgi:hypothetical protein
MLLVSVVVLMVIRPAWLPEVIAAQPGLYRLVD